MKKVFFLFFFLVLGASKVFAAPEMELYVHFLQTKEEIHLQNLKNKDRDSYVPREVLWVENQGPLVVPRQNPFKRVFDPMDQRADSRGMVQVPNVDEGEENKELDRTRETLRQMTTPIKVKSVF